MTTSSSYQLCTTDRSDKVPASNIPIADLRVVVDDVTTLGADFMNRQPTDVLHDIIRYIKQIKAHPFIGKQSYAMDACYIGRSADTPHVDHIALTDGIVTSVILGQNLRHIHERFPGRDRAQARSIFGREKGNNSSIQQNSGTSGIYNKGTLRQLFMLGEEVARLGAIKNSLLRKYAEWGGSK